MLNILIWILVLIVSLTILVKSSNKFTEAAEKIGLFLGISPFVVGVTIIAIGTSLPELASSIIAVIQNNSEIVSGNIVGSNITNVLLILGISILMSKKITIKKEPFIKIDLMVFAVSAIILIFTMIDGKITLPESITLFLLFIIYITYIIKSRKPKTEKLLIHNIKKEKRKEKLYLTLVISILLIFISAKYTVDAVVQLSILINIGKDIIAATVIALGTSLPELAVSIIAAKKGKPQIAIGNILGSNIFNTFLVVGAAGFFGTIAVTQNILIIGSFFMILSTMLYYFIIKNRVIRKWQGILLILLYIFFIIKITGLA